MYWVPGARSYQEIFLVVNIFCSKTVRDDIKTKEGRKVIKTFTPSKFSTGEYLEESYLIFLNLRLPSSTTYMQDPSSRSHFQQYMQPPWKAIHSMSMYCWLYKYLKPNLVFIFGICWKCMHFLEVNNKLINGKSNREPGMEGAGEKSGLGFRFMFSSSTSLKLFSRMFLSEGQFNF